MEATDRAFTISHHYRHFVAQQQLDGHTLFLHYYLIVRQAIDVWMSTNLVFVFAATWSTPWSTVLSRRYKKTISGRRPKTSSTAKVNIGCLLLLCFWFVLLLLLFVYFLGLFFFLGGGVVVVVVVGFWVVFLFLFFCLFVVVVFFGGCCLVVVLLCFRVIIVIGNILDL